MRPRIHSIDAIRGFCLINIFINHLTLGQLNALSPSRFAFSDSAEAFVLLAGISCYLAYGPREGIAFFPKRAAAMWARAQTLYVFYAITALASIAILAASHVFVAPIDPAGSPLALTEKHGLATYAWHVLTMQQPAGLAAILRLYVVLLLLAPAYVWLASKRYWYPLVPATAIWLVAGHFGLAEKESLTGDRLVLTVLPWNFVFAAGVAIGAGLAGRVRLPTSRAAIALAAGLVLAPLVCVMAAGHSPEMVAWIAAKDDSFWSGVSKPLASPLRVAHVLALAYLIAALREAPVVRLVHKVSPDNPLSRLGRHSLQVFTCGAIIATIGDQLLWSLFSTDALQRASPGALAVEMALAAIGVAAMLWVADRSGKRRSAPDDPQSGISGPLAAQPTGLIS
jgi:hypothetical protein